jgi:TonB family protein
MLVWLTAILALIAPSPKASSCPLMPVVVVKWAHLDEPPSEKTPPPLTPVMLKVSVSAQGKATSVLVTKSSGAPDYDRWAVREAYRNTYRAATRNCRPIPSVYRYESAYNVTE